MTQSRMPRGRRLRILTWHVHGNYLYALGQVPHDFVIPVLPGNPLRPYFSDKATGIQ